MSVNRNFKRRQQKLGKAHKIKDLKGKIHWVTESTWKAITDKLVEKGLLKRKEKDG